MTKFYVRKRQIVMFGMEIEADSLDEALNKARKEPFESFAVISTEGSEYYCERGGTPQRKFPIKTDPRSDAYIPWNMIEPHKRQAAINHGFSLERLAELGGVTIPALVAILEDREYIKMDRIEARDRLADLILEFCKKNGLNVMITDLGIN